MLHACNVDIARCTLPGALHAGYVHRAMSNNIANMQCRCLMCSAVRTLGGKGNNPVGLTPRCRSTTVHTSCHALLPAPPCQWLFLWLLVSLLQPLLRCWMPASSSQWRMHPTTQKRLQGGEEQPHNVSIGSSPPLRCHHGHRHLFTALLCLPSDFVIFFEFGLPSPRDMTASTWTPPPCHCFFAAARLPLAFNFAVLLGTLHNPLLP